MARRFFFLPETAERAVEAYRARFNGSEWPNTGVGWQLLDSLKQSAIESVMTRELSERIARDGNLRAEYRAFLAELTHGEPQRRIVDPIPVDGNTAPIGQSSLDGYYEAVAARDAYASNDVGSDEL